MLGHREALLLKIFYFYNFMISVTFEQTVGISFEGDDRPSHDNNNNKSNETPT